MYTIYLDDSNQVTITCPKCKSEKNIDTANFKDAQNKLEGKCKCGEPYQFNIEFRKSYRKEVRLPGEYMFPGIEHKEDIAIKELSFMVQNMRKSDCFVLTPLNLFIQIKTKYPHGKSGIQIHSKETYRKIC